LLPEADRLSVLSDLSDAELRAIEYDWRFWARQNQLPPPGDWTFWLLLAGRGFGKTRTGAEWVREAKNTCSRIALVAPTAADVRDVMVEGESGILAISPPHDRPLYEPSKRRLTWPNGAIATTYSADEPERLRGPQSDAAWCDELAAWRYPEAFDMLMFGLRLGTMPRCVITTTPKPVKLVRDLLTDPRCKITRGSTYDNAANLAESFMAQVVRKYEGTRLGRQELNAELLEDVPGAMWNRAMLDNLRVGAAPTTLRRVVVAIDPAVTSGESADETGIVVAGLGDDGMAYVLDDLTCKDTPDGWARRAVTAYRIHKADRIVAEVNNGGDLVEATIRMVDRRASFTAVRATRGKAVRAEPVAALYEQGRVHHVGMFPAMEDQMCAFTTDVDRKSLGYSPDRVDALVWALTELMVDPQSRPPLRISAAALAMA
jgi:predicted phage terminase large subunit-like protein